MIVRLNINGDYWLAKWTDHLGRRRARSLGNRAKMTKREALAVCADIGHKEAANPSRDGKAPTLEEWGAKYLALREHELAEGTLALHKKTVAYLVEHYQGVRIDALTRMDAKEWRGKLAEKKLAAGTIAMHIRNAKVLFETAVELDLIDANPFDREVGTAPRVAKNWAEITDADLGKILDACPDDEWRRLFALCRWAGLRIGEVQRLAWDDIRWDAHELAVVPPGSETTKKRYRTVPIRPELYRMLTDGHWHGGSGLVADVGKYNIDRTARAIIKRAGLAPYSKPFHTLRKCCETEWMARCPVLDVASWLGHSPTVAAAHYTRPTAESVARVTKKGTESSQSPQPVA